MDHPAQLVVAFCGGEGWVYTGCSHCQARRKRCSPALLSSRGPGDVPGDVRHFGWLPPPRVLTAVVGRNRWCRLPARKPSAAAGFCLYAHLRVCRAAALLCGPHLGCLWTAALGVSLWNAPATVLWAGDQPGDVRHFGWLRHPVLTAVVGRNRRCRRETLRCGWLLPIYAHLRVCSWLGAAAASAAAALCCFAAGGWLRPVAAGLLSLVSYYCWLATAG